MCLLSLLGVAVRGFRARCEACGRQTGFDQGCCVWCVCANWLRVDLTWRPTRVCMCVCNNCSCRVPLQHLEARFALRAARPAAESVEDEVQAALAAEAAQLKDVSTQLHARVGAAAQQIAHLNLVSAALLQHITDKDAALSLEEKVALMDGRKLPAVPRSPTVLSVSVVKSVFNSPHSSCLLLLAGMVLDLCGLLSQLAACPRRLTESKA